MWTPINGVPITQFFTAQYDVLSTNVSTRRKDNDTVNWAANTGLGDKISYISPVVSHTFPAGFTRTHAKPGSGWMLRRSRIRPLKACINGITVDFPKILMIMTFGIYRCIENRVYELYISNSIDEDSFILQPPYMDSMQPCTRMKPGSGISAWVTCFGRFRRSTETQYHLLFQNAGKAAC